MAELNRFQHKQCFCILPCPQYNVKFAEQTFTITDKKKREKKTKKVLKIFHEIQY